MQREDDAQQEELVRLAADLWQREFESFLRQDGGDPITARVIMETTAHTMRSLADGLALAALFCEHLARATEPDADGVHPPSRESMHGFNHEKTPSHESEPNGRADTGQAQHDATIPGGGESVFADGASDGYLAQLIGHIAQLERRLARLEARSTRSEHVGKSSSPTSRRRERNAASHHRIAGLDHP